MASGNAGQRRGMSEPRMRGSGGSGAIAPLGAGSGGDAIASFGQGGGGLLGSGGLFGGRDPFAEFSSMEPFGGRDPFAGFGGFGGMGSIMKQFDGMSNGSLRDAGGNRHGGGGHARSSAVGGPSSGSYSSQTFCMSSGTGPDGKMHTEKYTSSDVGNHERNIRESQQAYSNSATAKDKMSLERHLGDRARKTVKQYDRQSQEERSTELFRGMDESSRGSFDRDFGGQAHHLPKHGRGPGSLDSLGPGCGLQAVGPRGNSGHRGRSTPSFRR